MHAVAGGGGSPTGQGARFGNAFLQNLAVLRFAVTQHGTDVFRCIALAHTGINANLLEQVGHAKGARFVGHDGHQALAKGHALGGRGADGFGAG